MPVTSWSVYLGLVAFFTILFGVFFLITYSALAGVVENYRRYYQKADLQWTGPSQRKAGRPKALLMAIIASAVLTAWLVVHFVILP